MPVARRLNKSFKPEIGLFLIGLAFLASGCLYHASHRPFLNAGHADRVPPESTVSAADYFRYTPMTEDPEILDTRDGGNYVVERLRFPTHTAYLYLPKTDRPGPAGVVLPISNGDFLSEHVADYLASHGYAALRFKTRKGILAKPKGEPLDAFSTHLREYIIDILQATDWLTRHPKVDPDRIGLVGISLGAVSGAIVMGIEPRIRAGVLMLGGGNLTGVLLTSEEKTVRRIRESLRRQGLSDKQIREKIRTQLHQLEPTHYARPDHPGRILMINAYLDDVIKPRYAKTLWKAFGKPELIQVPAGHYTAILFLPYAEHKTLEHFEKRLTEPRTTLR
jgi:dienelactone hydrolase